MICIEWNFAERMNVAPYLLYLSLSYVLISVVTDANLFSANAHTLSHHILFLLLNLLSLSAVLHFSISPLFKHLCGARCTSAPWVFCTPVRRMLAPDLCFGPLKAGKVSWWTIFLVAIVMSEDLERCSGTGMQWQLLACEFSHWDMEHWGSEQRRRWGETPTRTHIIIAHSALADHTVPGSVYGGDKSPKRGENHVGLSEGQRGFVSECVCNDECWRNSTLKFCFVIEGCYILYKNTFAY